MVVTVYLVDVNFSSVCDVNNSSQICTLELLCILQKTAWFMFNILYHYIVFYQNKKYLVSKI